MTKLHKIDREKLAEVLNMRRKDMDAYEFDLLKEAAENWLTITDPGFEVSDEMIGNFIRFEIKNTMADNVEVNAYCAHVKKIMLESIFKTMIAKAGE